MARFLPRFLGSPESFDSAPFPKNKKILSLSPAFQGNRCAVPFPPGLSVPLCEEGFAYSLSLEVLAPPPLSTDLGLLSPTTNCPTIFFSLVGSTLSKWVSIALARFLFVILIKSISPISRTNMFLPSF